MNTFLAGLFMIAISVSMFTKPDIFADLIQPTFFVDKLGTSSRGAYQIMGLLGFILGIVVMFGLFGKF